MRWIYSFKSCKSTKYNYGVVVRRFIMLSEQFSLQQKSVGGYFMAILLFSSAIPAFAFLSYQA